MPKIKSEDIPEKGILATRKKADGRRRISLSQSERATFERLQLAEACAALFLDLKQKRKWPEIAAELNITPAQLKQLTKTEEFVTAYDGLFAELGHDPRYQAAQGALADMLPQAIETLGNLVENERTPPSVKLKAALEIIEMNQVKGMQGEAFGREQLATFLKEEGLAPDPIELPDEYAEAMAQYGVAVVDVTPEEIEVAPE